MRLTHDQMADASYLSLRGYAGEKVARTVEVGDEHDLQVDLDAAGRLVGVERYAGVLTLEDLTEVLLRVRWDEES